LLFTAHADGDGARLLVTRLQQDGWTTPVAIHLAAGQRKEEMEAFFSPDGKHIYFAPYDEGLDVRIWKVGWDGHEWGEASPLPGIIADDPAFYPTSALSGRIYYTNIAKREVWVADEDAEGNWQATPLGLEFGGHGFVAPDESFILLDARREDGQGLGDIYVAFALEDGGWTTPVNLGPGVNSAFSESCPSLSPDGRYLFFSRYEEEGGLSQIYWASADVIEAVRPE
jgi:Tol biopolymer transport system component